MISTSYLSLGGCLPSLTRDTFPSGVIHSHHEQLSASPDTQQQQPTTSSAVLTPANLLTPMATRINAPKKVRLACRRCRIRRIKVRTSTYFQQLDLPD